MTNISHTQIKAPPHCETMSEVRAGVDEIDKQLIELLALRFGYMDAAARIKEEKSAVRDEDRKAQVIANAVAMAQRYDLPHEKLALLWNDLVEMSIAHETDKWDDIRA